MEFTMLSRLNSQILKRIDDNKQHERMHFLHKGHWRMNIYPCGLQQCRKMLVKLSKVFKALSIGVKKKNTWTNSTNIWKRYILPNINHCIIKEYIFYEIAFIFIIIIIKNDLKINWTIPNKNKTIFPNMKKNSK